jgi:hypothetical protein
MKKKKERDILSIEIVYDYKEELNELVDSEDFNRLLFEEAISTIENALDKKRESARVFYIPNLDCSVVLEERNFTKVLNTAIKFYEQQEEYDKCAELVTLKNKVNGSKERNKGSN